MTPELLLLLLLLSLEGVEFCLARKDDGDEDEEDGIGDEGDDNEDDEECGMLRKKAEMLLRHKPKTRRMFLEWRRRRKRPKTQLKRMIVI